MFASQKRRSLWRVVFWMAIPTLFLGAVYLTYVFYTFDEPPPFDADLLAPREVVAREENGFYLLDLKTSDIVWSISNEERAGFESGDKWDADVVHKVLEENRSVLEKFDAALRLPKFQIPELRSTNDLNPDEFMARRIVEMLVSLRVMALFRGGKEKEALDEAVKLIRFGHRMEGGSACVVHFLTASAIKMSGIDRFLWLLPRTKLTESDLRPYLAELSRYPAPADGLAGAFSGEYRLQVEWIDRAKSGGEVEARELRARMRGLALILPRWLFFNPNRTKRLLAEAYRPVIEALSRGKVPESGMNDELEINPWLPNKNLMGKTLVREIIESILGFVSRIPEERWSLQKARLLLALRCYQVARGKLPATLEELVPVYLDELPRDPYAGEFLVYSAEEKTVRLSGKAQTKVKSLKPVFPNLPFVSSNAETSFKIEF